MNYILLLISVAAITLKASVINNFSKSRMTGLRDMYIFNAMFALAAIIFMLLVGKGMNTFSVYTVLMGVVYGLMTMGSEVCSMKAMQHGPMSFAVFLSSCGMLLPVAFGILVFREEVTLVKYISLALLIGAIYLVINPKNSQNKTYKWLIYGLITMVLAGLVGILQKIHQGSDYKQQLSLFLVSAFGAYFFASLLLAVFYKKDGSGAMIKKSLVWISVLSGICCGANNIINLYLSGVLPAIVFFPIANGGYILLATLSARFIFREKLSFQQMIGMILGVLALCGLGI